MSLLLSAHKVAKKHMKLEKSLSCDELFELVVSHMKKNGMLLKNAEYVKDYLSWSEKQFADFVSLTPEPKGDEVYYWYSVVCRCIEKKLKTKLLITLERMKELEIAPSDELRFLHYYFPLDKELVELAKSHGFTDSYYKGSEKHTPYTNKYVGWRITMHRLYYNYGHQAMFDNFLGDGGACDSDALFEFEETQKEKYLQFMATAKEVVDAETYKKVMELIDPNYTPQK